MTSREFQDRLARRAAGAGVTLDSALQSRLEAYFRLLALWNRTINLTGLDLDDPSPEALDRLLIEPIVAARYAPPATVRLIDIGSGGGSPAIPFALAVPGVHLLMVESKVRKSVFLKEATRALEMAAEVAPTRFEALLKRPAMHEAHDVLTVRAVRLDPRTLKMLQAFVRPMGELFLFRAAAASRPAADAVPALAPRATFPLIQSRSELAIFQKPSPAA